jgi:hypothetical protein
LSWPTDFAGFNLETGASLPATAAWQTIPGPYLLSNGYFGVSVSRTNGPAQFFRLRKPLP